ncbi:MULTISPECIES: hypothetical protein [Beduini]|uniref:hypothetical protein n=1 Tax=Beduini TaxID=1922299 RepID=UPI0012DFEB0F|nr:hypothetical protein [Beduini massiliensis]
MLEKKIDRNTLINELSNDFFENRSEIERMPDDKLAELYNEWDHHHEITYPNGNDFL